jgi:type II secretory pathway pseudopilin PulG
MRRHDKEIHSSPFYSEKGFIQVTVIVIIVLALSALSVLGYLYYRQQEAKQTTLTGDVQDLQMRVIDLEKITESLGKKVNLTIPSVQKIDTVFLVSKLTAKKYLTGVKVSGVMINSSSLEHNDARFRITINDVSREFAISKIKPGSSKKFEVDVPDVAFENLSEAEIKSLASSVSYFVD